MLYWLLLLGKDSKEVEEHKTLAGMLHWMGALEERGYRSLHSLVASTRVFRHDTSSYDQLEYSYSVSAHLRVSVCHPNWLTVLLMDAGEIHHFFLYLLCLTPIEINITASLFDGIISISSGYLDDYRYLYTLIPSSQSTHPLPLFLFTLAN